MGTETTETTPTDAGAGAAGEAPKAGTSTEAEVDSTIAGGSEIDGATEGAGKENPTEKDAGEGGEENEGSQGDDAKAGAAKDFEPRLPEGVTANKALLDPFKALVKESKLDHGVAQKVIDLYANAQKAADQAAQEGWKTQTSEWKKAVETDSELGGKNLPETTKQVRGVLAKFGGTTEQQKELRDLLNNSGLGNHPALVRLFRAIGKADAEDTVKGTKSDPSRPLTEAEIVAKRYPATAGMGKAS